MHGSAGSQAMDQHPVYRFDDFVVDPEEWRFTRDGQEIHLDPVVLRLLIYLIAHRGRLVTRQELMDTVWSDTVISDSALTKAAARLRKALGDDSATPRYLETVRSQGYRFVADVEEAKGRGAPGPPSRRAPAQAARLIAGLAAIVTLVFLAVLWFRAPQQEEAIHSLAVLPLKNLTGDPEQAHYAAGLQDLLITALYELPEIGITSRQSTLRYRESDLPMADIARELGVDAVLEGSLLRAGSEIELTLQLIDGRSDRHIWAEQYVREQPLALGLVSDIATAIGNEFGSARASPEAYGRIDPDAIEAYGQGIARLELLSPDGIRAAITQLEKAVALEPKFAQGWGALAWAYAADGLFGMVLPRDAMNRGHAAALKAIEADERFYGGHAALGWARLWTGDFDGACELFEKALRLNPSGPGAIHGVADCLMFEGHTDETIAHLRKLITISPFEVINNVPLGAHLWMARRYDEAVAAAKDMQARIPQFSMHGVLAKIYWQQGLHAEALAEERLELERRGDTILLAALEEGLAADGPAGAMRLMAEALAARAGETYVNSFEIGETFARADMVDEALHWLEKAMEDGSFKINYLAFWPPFDVLRDDARYRDLFERVYGRKARDILRLENSGPRQD